MKRLLLPALGLVILLVAAPLRANPGRAVYANGMVHRISYSNSGTIKHQAGVPTDPANGNWVFNTLVGKSDSGYHTYYNMMMSASLAVFDNKIFIAYNSYDSGYFSYMKSWVATWDMTKSAWIGKKNLGYVHVDNGADGNGTGAAITVFDDQLYVFTDSGTYTSSDGVSWAVHGPLVSDSRYQPLDAVTYYLPSGEPRIVVAYGYIASSQNYWDYVSQTTWNGKFGGESDFGGLAKVWNLWLDGNFSLQTGTMGAFQGAPGGDLVPSVQAFGVTGSSSNLRFQGWVLPASGPATQPASHTFGSGVSDIWTYPWLVDVCDTSTTPPHQARRQYLVVQYTTGGSATALGAPSDFLVPPEPTGDDSDLPSYACGLWGGSVTDTGNQDDPEDAATYRKYWSLYGVVLGSPPFAINEIEDDYGIEQLSNVVYGQESGTMVGHQESRESQWMFSAGAEVRAGLKKGPIEVETEVRADIGYQHLLTSEQETTTTTTSGWAATLGTKAQKTLRGDALGRFGWGIFGIPEITVQDFRVYGWDYDVKTQTGTYLNQDVHLVDINPQSLTIKPVAFELVNPGGPNDDYPGLFSGMQAFGKSTDLDFWHDQVWETTTQPWTVRFGKGTYGEPKVNPLSFGTGSVTNSTISNEQETVSSSGLSQKIEIGGGASLNVGTKLKGLKVDLNAGYDSSFSTTVTNATSFGSELELELTMAPCAVAEPECVTSVTDEVYMLSPTAVADGQAAAPWLPTAYASQLPWAIAWRTSSYATAGGAASGLGAPPESATGLVVSGQGGTTASGESAWSRYVLRGAPLAWADAHGEETPLPMTAAQFKPARGVELDLNGFTWSSLSASGTWTRNGKVWLYESRRSVKRNRVFLKLDFGRRTWDLELYKADLSGHLAANSGNVQATLVLNGKYSLKHDLQHHVELAWRWHGAAKNPKALEVTSYEGSSDSATGNGEATIEGTLPGTLGAFGDLAFELNGHAVQVPLLEREGFLESWKNGGRLLHDANGLHLVLDFGQKTWSATFERSAFHRLMAPVRGAATVKVRVGGRLLGSSVLDVADFTSRLRLDD